MSGLRRGVPRRHRRWRRSPAPPRIASRPAFDSVMMPTMQSPSMIGAANVRCSMPRMPASSTNVSATTLNPSESSSNDSDWLSGTAAPISCARVSNSRPMPFASTVSSCRYHAMPSTPTAVMLPPKHPNRSTNVTSTPVRAAASAAAKPAGPEPTTRTSVSWITSICRAGSVMLPSVRRREAAVMVMHSVERVDRTVVESAQFSRC